VDIGELRALHTQEKVTQDMMSSKLCVERTGNMKIHYYLGVVCTCKWCFNCDL